MTDLGEQSSVSTSPVLPEQAGAEDTVWRCGNCGSDDLHFDRTLCACGSMHHYCGGCGLAAEACA